jgi:hypothetical protein
LHSKMEKFKNENYFLFFFYKERDKGKFFEFKQHFNIFLFKKKEIMKKLQILKKYCLSLGHSEADIHVVEKWMFSARILSTRTPSTST